MWRIGVLVVSVVLLHLTSAEVHPGAHETLLHRLKRSPQYCGPDYPPPPPPPFWPPPPPPPFWRHHPPPHPPPYWPPPPPPQEFQAYSASNSQAGAGQSSPCTTCGTSGESSAISNAESGTGEAIAVAVAKARSSGK